VFQDEFAENQMPMSSIDGMSLDFKRLDQLATGDTPLHRLDARAKVLVVLVFVLCVVSFSRYELSAMVPFFIFPIFLVTRGDLPIGYLLRKVGIVIPFALVVGIFNPLFDREIMVDIGTIGISGGWLSCASIIVRALLTVGTSLMLVAVTGFADICRALERLGMPQAFAVQLLFLYRYVFVLTEEGARASRARELRTFGKRGKGFVPFGNIIGHLLLRTWQRAERIHMAMLARGFTGEFRTASQGSFGAREFVFVAGWATLFVTLRLVNLPQALGSYVTGNLP
jgi:cobalt/nickel transport system permease protein